MSLLHSVLDGWLDKKQEVWGTTVAQLVERAVLPTGFLETTMEWTSDPLGLQQHLAHFKIWGLFHGFTGQNS